MQSLYLRLLADGPTATLRLAAKRLFGSDQRLVFVRHHDAPAERLTFPFEENGICVRDMEEADLRDLQVRKHQPRAARDITHTFVATKGTAIVGAAWYSDSIDERQPWYAAVRSQIEAPSRLTENYYVLRDVKGAAAVLTKAASQRLAEQGVRTIVGIIGADNKASILMSRLLGGKHAATIEISYRFGIASKRIVPITRDATVFAKQPHQTAQ